MTNRRQVWEVLAKVQAANLLTAEEMTLLEQAVCSEAQPPRPRGWQRLVDCWLDEYERALGVKRAKLLPHEGQLLMKVARCVGGAEQCCEVIRAFFPWRETLTWDWLPAAAPHALDRHLGRVQEWMAKRARRAERKDVEHQRVVECQRFEPIPDDARRMIRQLAQGVTLPQEGA